MASKKGSGGKVVDIRTRKVVSGENIPEAHRNTVAVKLRLNPVFADVIRKAAKGGLGEDDMTMSEMIEHAFYSWCKNGGGASKNDVRAMGAVLDERYGHPKGSSDE